MGWQCENCSLVNWKITAIWKCTFFVIFSRKFFVPLTKNFILSLTNTMIAQNINKSHRQRRIRKGIFFTCKHRTAVKLFHIVNVQQTGYFSSGKFSRLFPYNPCWFIVAIQSTYGLKSEWLEKTFYRHFNRIFLYLFFHMWKKGKRKKKIIKFFSINI